MYLSISRRPAAEPGRLRRLFKEVSGRKVIVSTEACDGRERREGEYKKEKTMARIRTGRGRERR